MEKQAIARLSREQMEWDNPILRLLDAHNAWVADGRKTFIATAEMFEAFQHVELDINKTDYQQSYPCIQIRMPNGIECYLQQTKVYEEGGSDEMHPCLTFVAVATATAGAMRPGEVSLGMWFLDRPGTFEYRDWDTGDFKNDENDEKKVMLIALERVAINCSLAAANYPHRLMRLPLPRLGLNRRPLPRRIRRRKEAEQPQMIEFIEQNIRWHDTAAETETDHEVAADGGGHNRPHWRKGYWRRQAIGKRGLGEHKIVFIRPVLVNGGFVLNPFAGSTTYAA